LSLRHPGFDLPQSSGWEVAGMVYREVSVIEVREAMRAWLAGKSERAVAAQAGVDRKTGKRYVTAAVAAGLSCGGGEEQLTDELIGEVVSVVRPVRPDGHGQGWAELEARREQIAKWAEGGVPAVKIGILLARQGVVVAERTLHRFVAGRCGGKKLTTPVDDGPSGSELRVDFGDLGLIPAGDGKRRKLRALVFTACFSRYMFVYLTFSTTLEEAIAGCEDAWQFFSGVFRVVVPVLSALLRCRVRSAGTGHTGRQRPPAFSSLLLFRALGERPLPRSNGVGPLCASERYMAARSTALRVGRLQRNATRTPPNTASAERMTDNMSPVVAKADAVNPQLTREWLEYSQARGFVTDPARVRHPRDKPRVEAGVHYVQGNFFAGESFLDLADARSKMAGWLAMANGRVHGTTRQVPAVVFAEQEAPCLLPPSAERYQVPYWAKVTVHVDYHIQVARALYSVPWRYAGAHLMARADEHLVKVYLRDQLIKTHPRKHQGGRSTDPADMPPGVEGYATRTVDRLVTQAACYGEDTGIYAQRLLDGDQPWMMMRSVYRLIGLAKRYGAEAAGAACSRALAVDVINVSKIESMLKNATEKAPAAGLATAASAGRGRFARDAAEYATATGIRLQVVPGGGGPAAVTGGEGGPPGRPGDRS
jgi:Mu transposase, C-terminal domain